MKNLVVAALAALSTIAFAQVYVNPYVKRDGTVVEGHFRSSPNSTDLDNYSTRGNVNPYTGEAGTKQPRYEQPSYQAPAYIPPPVNYGPQCGYTASGRYVCK
jgi:hypothetical protein